MVEVFKTNVASIDDAKFLLDTIHRHFIDCAANFDLDDCDLILRIKKIEVGSPKSEVRRFSTETIPVDEIIELLNKHGFYAAVLEDDFQFTVDS